MPEITSDTQRRPYKVQGAVLSFPLPYVEGHRLVQNEANALNQTYCENLRNNFAPQAKKFYEDHKAWDAEKETPTRILDPGEIDQLQTIFDAYIEGYEFGTSGGGRSTLDPVTRQARSMAEERIRAKIKGAGMKLSEITREKMNEMIDQALENNPKFMEKAAAYVASLQDAADDLSVDISA